MDEMMRAVVIRQPGGPEVLQIEQVPRPRAGPGQVLIRVEAFGLNRSELFTRQGHSPNVVFPRVLGIEAVGTVVDAPGSVFAPGTKVATVMGGMGRAFDGGYAEYTCVPAENVRSIETNLPWQVLGALPEMLQTAWGCLNRALRLRTGDRLLIRGGTTSVGLAALALAKSQGAFVAATTRDKGRLQVLRDNGADQVLVDDGHVAAQLRSLWPDGADKVLELVGTSTLLDSLLAAGHNGIVCMAGMVGNRWTIDNFEPMMAIPTGVCLTTYSGGIEDFKAMPFQQLVAMVESKTLPITLGPVFHLDDIVEAHRTMEDNRARGKIVVLTR